MREPGRSDGQTNGLRRETVRSGGGQIDRKTDISPERHGYRDREMREKIIQNIWMRVGRA